MARYVAFLRGMNLGRRRITNDELCGCFEDLGLSDVSAFLASGNVVFATRKRADGLERFIADGLERALGYDVRTFVRSAADVCAIAERAPFDADALAASTGKVQVALLGAAPSAPAKKRALAQATADDRLAIHGRELYWLPAGNMSDSELDVAGIEKAVGTMTIRTKRTLERIAAKYFAG